MKFTTQKLFEGYSTCFRQWRADKTHCKFLHGYAVSFIVYFEGDLDEKNWVFDFGGMKRSTTKMNDMNPEEYFKWLFDHTVIVSQDDPFMKTFEIMNESGIIRLRVLPKVGCERFAEYLHTIINQFLKIETQSRVRATKVTFIENRKNAASYEG